MPSRLSTCESCASSRFKADGAAKTRAEEPISRDLELTADRPSLPFASSLQQRHHRGPRVRASSYARRFCSLGFLQLVSLSPLTTLSPTFPSAPPSELSANHLAFFARIACSTVLLPPPPLTSLSPPPPPLPQLRPTPVERQASVSPPPTPRPATRPSSSLSCKPSSKVRSQTRLQGRVVSGPSSVTLRGRGGTTKGDTSSLGLTPLPLPYLSLSDFALAFPQMSTFKTSSPPNCSLPSSAPPPSAPRSSLTSPPTSLSLPLSPPRPRSHLSSSRLSSRRASDPSTERSGPGCSEGSCKGLGCRRRLGWGWSSS